MLILIEAVDLSGCAICPFRANRVVASPDMPPTAGTATRTTLINGEFTTKLKPMHDGVPIWKNADRR